VEQLELPERLEHPVQQAQLDLPGLQERLVLLVLLVLLAQQDHRVLLDLQELLEHKVQLGQLEQPVLLVQREHPV
jgi:hypothetical protein